MKAEFRIQESQENNLKQSLLRRALEINLMLSLANHLLRLGLSEMMAMLPGRLILNSHL
jgi:hypothetical protein